MSSIPTSLIVVLLVAAWLVVLVPMFARRREVVPESEDESTGFRVLRRSKRAERRQLRTREVDDVVDDQQDDDDDYSTATDLEERAVPVTVAARRSESVGDAADDWAAEHARSRPQRESPQRESPQRASRTGEYRPRADDFAAEYSAEYAAPDTDEHSRPIPRRRGRGGYDPDAAEINRRYRYRQRRRLVMILLVLAVVSGAAAYLVSPMYWAGTAVAGLLLIGYLTYLRRQVRIEEQIRQRRMARLRRARQVRPEYHRAQHDAPTSPYRTAPASVAPEYSEYGDYSQRSDYGYPEYAEPGARAASLPPANYHPGRVVMDLDDDDPAFDDLETYRSPVYRRRAG